MPNRFKVGFTKATKGIQEVNFNRAGTPVGFDMLYLADTSPGHAAVNVTLDTAGGFLYGTFTLNLKTGAVANGEVTGGPVRSREPPERSGPRPSTMPPPSTSSRSPTAGSQLRQPGDPNFNIIEP